jgi:hypothetical protein
MASQESVECRDSPESELADPIGVEGLRRLIADGGAPIDCLAGDMDSVRALIHSGEARLRIVVQPWGLEFDLVGATREVVSVAPRSPY